MKNQRFAGLIGMFSILAQAWAMAQEPPPASTFCNPLDIEYHLQAYKPGASLRPAAPGTPCWREAADPACVLFKGEYYLFASVSYGYWHSRDLVNWTRVEAPGLPLDYWEPNTFVIGDELYYGHHRDAIYKSADPQSGKWTKVRGRLGGTDTEGGFMVDDDGRVFHIGLRYPGERGFFVRELDPKNNLKDIGGLWPCDNRNGFRLVWERPDLGRDGYAGTYRLAPGEPWLIGGPTGEGAQIMKHGGTYFMQYAHSTGSSFYGYRDYVFTAASPKGPWSFQRQNPAAYDPTGFCKGAGNSCVFKDAGSEFWRVTTVDAEKLWLWERRIGIYPAGFDRDNTMYTDTYLGELPQYGAGKNPHPEKRNDLGGNLVGWMLLSYNKPVTASSTLAGFAPGLALDEEMTTWWSAKTGAGEWLAVDLEKPCTIQAVQVNFAEQDIFAPAPAGPHCHQYTLEVSDDGIHWRMLVDKSRNTRDVPHDYIQLDTPITARQVRLNILHMPAGGKAAVRGLRIFGNSSAPLPEPVQGLRVERLKDVPYDDRYAKVSWEPAKGAEGYVVRYGTAPDKLYLAVDVRNATELPVEIPLWKPYQSKFPWKKNSFLGLTGGIDYYFAIDSFNDRGITRGTTVCRAPAVPPGN